MTTKTQTTAREAFVAKKAELLANIARLQAMAEAFDEADPMLNWGNFGDIAHVNELALRAVNAFSDEG